MIPMKNSLRIKGLNYITDLCTKLRRYDDSIVRRNIKKMTFEPVILNVVVDNKRRVKRRSATGYNFPFEVPVK